MQYLATDHLQDATPLEIITPQKMKRGSLKHKDNSPRGICLGFVQGPKPGPFGMKCQNILECARKKAIIMQCHMCDRSRECSIQDLSPES